MTTLDFKIRTLTFSEIDENLIVAWEDLESRAIEPNPFLSPHFVLPALKYLEDSKSFIAMFIEKITPQASTLIGVALFMLSKPTKYFPLRHLIAFKTLYSYLSGFLIDHENAREAFYALFRFLSQNNQNWHGVFIEEQANEGASSQIESQVTSELGLKRHDFDEWDRAALKPKELPEGLDSIESKNVKKTVRRRMRRLEELGNVTWQVCYRHTFTAKTIDELLRLEHAGWKKEQGTSLLSKASHAIFFKEMMLRFNRKGRALATELTVDGKVISSETCLLANKNAFSLKIGWDMDYFKYSPGYLNISKWLDAKANIPGDLDFVDSGSSENASYMNELWPHRKHLRTGLYPLTKIGQFVMNVIDIKEKVKKLVNNQK